VWKAEGKMRKAAAIPIFIFSAAVLLGIYFYAIDRNKKDFIREYLSNPGEIKELSRKYGFMRPVEWEKYLDDEAGIALIEKHFKEYCLPPTLIKCGRGRDSRGQACKKCIVLNKRGESCVDFDFTNQANTAHPTVMLVLRPDDDPE
jgi:hypothetical protein